MVEYPSQNVYLLGKTSDSGAPVETCLFDFLLLLLFSGTKTLTVSFPVRQMQKKLLEYVWSLNSNVFVIIV